MSDWQNWTTVKHESNLSIVSMITELDDTKSCCQLIKTMTNLRKKLDYMLYIFISKQQLARQNVRQ